MVKGDNHNPGFVRVQIRECGRVCFFVLWGREYAEDYAGGVAPHPNPLPRGERELSGVGFASHPPRMGEGVVRRGACFSPSPEGRGGCSAWGSLFTLPGGERELPGVGLAFHPPQRGEGVARYGACFSPSPLWGEGGVRGGVTGYPPTLPSPYRPDAHV